MSFLNQNVRTVVAALCGLAYLTTMPEFSQVILAMMSGGHAVQMIAHDGHEDLLLHRDDDDACGAPDRDSETHAEHHSGHSNHHDHVVCLESDGSDVALTDSLTRTPLVTSCKLEYPTVSFIAGWKTGVAPVRPRPPPLIKSGAIRCLRTTVLVI